MKCIYLLFFYSVLFISFSYASDVDFISTGRDYGIDTDSDGKYNFLAIPFDVNVKIAGNYYFYSTIKDSSDNLYEADTTILLTPGIKRIVVKFDGAHIYKNKPTGYFRLTSTLIYRLNEGSPPPTPTFVNKQSDEYNTSIYDYLHFQRPDGTAAVYCQNSPCIASSSAISSRDTIRGKIEVNSPNTIDGCKDGSKGYYKLDESIENISILSKEKHFTKGSYAVAEIYIYCSLANDRLNIFYSNNSDTLSWKLIDYFFCGTHKGFTKFTTDITLDSGEGYHVVRAAFSDTGAISEACIGSDFTDNDDIAFYVWDSLCNDTDGDGFGVTASNLCIYSQLDCNDADASVNSLAPEKCDGIDTNCNGIIDEGCDCLDGIIRQCGSSVGECNTGIQTCSNGTWSTCKGSINPINETCDLKDNDCDDEIDEVCSYSVMLLAEGWNLVSFPQFYDSSQLNSSIFCNSSLIFSFRNNSWSVQNLSSNDILENTNKGFWINAGDACFIKYPKAFTPEHSFTLTQGWNLISYPYPTKQNISEVMSRINTSYEVILTYYNFSWYSHNKRMHANSLNYFEPGFGYFIYLNKNVSLTFNGSFYYSASSESNVQFNLTLNKGWNAISVPLETGITACTMLGNSSIFHYQNGWILLPCSSYLIPGKGYWVKSDIDRNLFFEGKKPLPITLNLSKGINFIGTSYLFDYNTSTFDSVRTHITSILVYENESWKTFSYNRFRNSLSTIKPNQGIFVLTNKNSSIEFPIAFH